MSAPRGRGRLLGTLLIAAAALVLVLPAGLVAVGPGRPSPVLGGRGRPVEGSIAEKLPVEIGGVELPAHAGAGPGFGRDAPAPAAGVGGAVDDGPSSPALDGPVKGLHTFPRSVHGPMFEEPERLRRILEQDVLREERALADPS